MKTKNSLAPALLALAALSSAGGVRRGGAESCDALPGVAGSWTAERALAPRTISNFYGAPRALAVDAGGGPHAAYGGDRLYHAYRDGGGWHHEVADSRQGVGDMVAIALDSANGAHIVYRDIANSAVRYATNASGAWATQLVAAGVDVQGVAIALDPAGRPRVVYQDSTADELRFATNATGAWATTRIDGGGQTCSIAVGADGSSHVAYALGFLFDGDHQTLRYATDASGRWKAQTVDATGGEDGFGNSIALDSRGKAHVLYAHTENSARVLRHATNASGKWVRDTLTHPQLSQDGASLAVDAADVVHVSAGAATSLVYFTNASGSFVAEEVGPGSGTTSIVARSGGLSILHHHGSVLRLTEGTSHAWTSGIADVSSVPWIGISMGLDGAGNAYVTNVDNTGSGGIDHAELDFTSNASGTWTTQVLDASARSHADSSLAIDGSAHAHVAYVHQGGGDPMRYATNASGSWVFENVLTPATGVAGLAIALDSQGRPRIAFQGSSQIRFSSRSSGVWTTQVVDANLTSPAITMGVDIDPADHAHIAYQDIDDQSVYYATNATGPWVRTKIGTASSTAFLVGVGSPSVAADAAGRAHVAWIEQTGGFQTLLRYSTNRSGSWTTVTVTGADYFCAPSIAVDAAGHVHIAFQCTGAFRYATDASGTWRSTVVDTGAGGERQFTADVFAADEGAGTGVVSVAPSGEGFCGAISSIRIAPDGSPRFAYSDELMGDVKFARPAAISDTPTATVDVTAAAGTAAAPADFTAQTGTLGWTADDTATKSFAVPLIGDALLEGSETITVTLSSPTGGAALGARATATLVVRDDDMPPGAVGPSFLPRLVKVKLAGTKSRLTASGFFDTGPASPLIGGPATLTIGGLTITIPSTVKTVRGLFRHKADGIDFTLRPSKTGSSRAIFRLVVSGRDLTGLVDPDAALTLRFDNVAVTGTGVVALTKGKYKLGALRGALVAPGVFLSSAKAKLAGGGKDSLTVKAGLASLGAAPQTAPDVRIAFGPGYDVTTPGGQFKKRGNKFTFRGGKTGITSAVLDYDRETLTISAKGVDLGTFATGAQPVVVTLGVGGAARTAVVRMVRSGTTLKY